MRICIYTYTYIYGLLREMHTFRLRNLDDTKRKMASPWRVDMKKCSKISLVNHIKWNNVIQYNPMHQIP